MFRGVVDNKQSGLVGDVLKENIQEGGKLSIAAAHFTLYAFQELKSELEKLDEIRFIFTEPAFVKGSHMPVERIEQNESKLFGVEEEIQYKNELSQQYIAKKLSNWLHKKVTIRSVVNQRVDASFYHLENKDGSQLSLVGGAPFSSAGLGYTNSYNMYLNTIVQDTETNIKIKQVFNQMWNNKQQLQDVKNNVLQRVESMYNENSPEFAYFVTIYNIFKKFLEENEDFDRIQQKTGFQQTEIWNRLYSFQRDGVVGAINKIETYGGCIIADSVGLGKTFEALAVIKYYELKNHRVLVLAPKKLRENWSVYRLNDKRNILANDRFSYDLLNHTDLSREGGYSGDINLEHVNWGNYDLIVIDESHNFRNNPKRKDRITRYERLMQEIIKSGVKTKVLMLSATPVNNNLNDLKNQIAFITEGNDTALQNSANIDDISATIRQAQHSFNKWSEIPEEKRTTERLLEMLDWDYFTLLDSLTIARSRRHIEKYYNMSDIGKFPKRLAPITIKEKFDTLDRFPSLEAINNDILRLRLAIYSPMKYILPNMKQQYKDKYDTKIEGRGSLRQEDRENSLIYLMKASLLKRLESSISSFTLTIQKVIENINIMLAKADNFNIEEAYSRTIANIEDMDSGELEDMAVGSKVKILLKDVDLIRWKQDLENDRIILEKLYEHAKVVDAKRDLKLKALKKLIHEKVNQPINDENKKIIVFTAFADTAKYLYEHLHLWMKEEYGLHTSLVTGSDNPKTTLKLKKADFNSVLVNFSPRSKERNKVMPEMEEEIDLLIATDCISEGQNLQDCDYLINYDIHWNPVRIIQRFGRIDRLGSQNECIQLVNFYPPMELDEYINLVSRVKDRMAILDISSTGEENVIAESSEMKDLEYRRKQLQRLQEEVIDLEDISGNVSLTDFTMDDFRIDLVNYMKNNEDAIKNVKYHIFSLTKNENMNVEDEVKPGVIYCLKQINNFSTNAEKNALHPFYLVYIKENGEILYSHGHVKKILDLYRSLCLGKNETYKELYTQFNLETRNAKKMTKYKELLEAVVEDIVGKNEQQATLDIFSMGSLDSLLTSSNSGVKDYEIISCLIIRGDVEDE
ncbi:helicase-related protein [Bacillus cereus group sp. BY17LC]|uniref:helicase-related protein n=1 Tax=Bacillus cereus group sp. BY17LC TaxID=3018082 RepID=UPI0022E7D297|nr:helicase-related protein [Bacillus cereus group sp. BY17LC]MDA1839637.1 helicase-related protein [Bacillus cereus group sp. BY17LC]